VLNLKNLKPKTLKTKKKKKIFYCAAYSGINAYKKYFFSAEFRLGEKLMPPQGA